MKKVKMKKNLYILSTTLLLLIGVILFFVYLLQETRDKKTEANKDTASSNTKIFTKDDVASHSSTSDCWTIVDNSVYDITKYINRHPGGSEIERACGNDATSLFKTRRSKSGVSIGSGSPHSPTANEQLQSLKIGELRK